VLAITGQRAVLSSTLGLQFLDKRELQNSLPTREITHGAPDGDTWIDYVADTGDGFDATYSIAWLTGQRQLYVGGVNGSLPRPGLLVFGGDEVYPVASPTGYDNRFRGPYTAALPYMSADNPKLLAIPGNHDWYDGLTNFMRFFCPADPNWIGGRKAEQTRSYFAVRLPHDWWLWGIDIQFDAYIDDPQIRYFKSVAAQMGAGSRLILCTGKPSWTEVNIDPHAYRNLAFLESRVIRKFHINLLLSISGDSHHYAHYVSEHGTHKITAGGGGAFLHPTHHLDDSLRVPIDPSSDKVETYRLRVRYPEASTSRRLSLEALRLPLTNPQFMLLPALIYLVISWASQFANRLEPEHQGETLEDAAQQFGWLDHLVGVARNPVSVVVLLVVLAGLISFAKPPGRWAQGSRKLAAKGLMGTAHLAMQVAVGALVGNLAIDVAAGLDGWPHAVVLAILIGALGGLVGTIVMATYLAFSCAFLRAHINEAFSAMSLTSYKNFLRMHIDERGRLTVYPIGLDETNHDWTYDADNAESDASWLRPTAGPLAPRLIEDPIVVTPPAVGDRSAQDAPREHVPR
jgi:hypothetical protein